MQFTHLCHYRIQEKIGSGGMGEVYAASDSKLSREVAIKLLPDSIADEDRKQRFLQEARMAARLNHPAIMQVYDLDEDQGTFFLVMERVQGCTISDLISRKDLDLLGALEVAIQVADGLYKAHEAGMIHRDIKSSNVMLTPDGHVKILDFGLAKLLQDTFESEDSHMQSTVQISQKETQVGTIKGTVAYMSPEQVKGGTVDFRSDLFSLGVMLFEMITATLPFKRSNTVDTMHAIGFEEPASIQSLRPNTPEELQEVVAKCLRKRPEDRYANAAFLAHDLRSVKRSILTGRSSRFSLSKWLGEEWQVLRQVKGGEYVLYGMGIVGACLVFLFTDIQIHFGSIFFFTLMFLILFRHIRHQPYRVLEKFVRTINRYPEVMLVRVQQSEITVILEQVSSKLYDRLNQQLSKTNQRLFFGEPYRMCILQQNQDTDFRSMLNLPGVRYVRQDVLEKYSTLAIGDQEPK